MADAFQFPGLAVGCHRDLWDRDDDNAASVRKDDQLRYRGVQADNSVRRFGSLPALIF